MAMRRLLTRYFRFYKRATHKAFSPKYLLYTNLLLSMGISTLGDFIEQNYELYQKEIDKYDVRRTAQMGLSGLTTGFICHHWYIALDKIIVGRTLYMAVKKLLLDQFICSPFIILTFFATVAIFEEDPLSNFTDEVKDKFWQLYKAEWVVWPPAQMINFYFLPTRFRILYDNTISLGYDIYTSHIKHKKPHTQTEKSKSET